VLTPPVLVPPVLLTPPVAGCGEPFSLPHAARFASSAIAAIRHGTEGERRDEIRRALALGLRSLWRFNFVMRSSSATFSEKRLTNFRAVRLCRVSEDQAAT
jgi:hypothetical protein